MPVEDAPSASLDLPKGMVSVIIPVFRRSGFLAEAVQSVLAQTHSRIEIIIVDDGSGEDFVGQYRLPAQARLIRLPVNGGPSAARNAGIAAARGEFIAFLDSDDLWLPDKLRRQVLLFRTQPDIGLTYCNHTEIDQHANALGAVRPIRPPGPDPFRALLRSPIIKTPSTVMLRRELLPDGCRFDPAMRYGEDRDLWLCLALRHRFQCDPAPLVRYRVHSGQLTCHRHRLANARAELKTMNRWRRWIREHRPGCLGPANRAVCSSYRELAKAQHRQDGSTGLPLRFLCRAARACPWDHRVYSRMLQLLLRKLWSKVVQLRPVRG